MPEPSPNVADQPNAPESRMLFVTAYRIAGYYLTLLLFAAGGMALNLGCAALGWLPHNHRSERFFQRAIHRAFRLFTGWMAFIRICRIRYDEGFLRLPPGGVIVANHPGLMDITYLLARIPQAICIFKPAIRRNPVLGYAAVRAGYVVNSEGVDAIRLATDKVAAGHTLVIFPEGTRTPPGQAVGPLRPGFALIARRAAVPVQVVQIRCNSNVLAKGHAWWRPPQLPVEVSIELGPRFEPGPDTTPTALAAVVERWWRDVAGGASVREAEPTALAATAEIRACG